MRGLVCGFVLAIIALPCGSQTLGDELSKAGIPAGKFSSTELAQGVNAASARDGDSAYLAYMRVDANNMFTGLPVLVRFDRSSGEFRRKELDPKDKEICCGSPLDLQFTGHYALISFHDSPSANTVLVTDKTLRLVEVLFGFDIHEIAPDVVIFTEDMVHFAPEHAERKGLVDLAGGSSQELYPPKGDILRTKFAKIHEQHMPSTAECQEANDPCDPETYDESLTFREGLKPGQFQLLVTRTAEHTWVSKDHGQAWPTQFAAYTYGKGKSGWLYCEREDTAARLTKGLDHAMPAAADQACEPNLPVEADESGQENPFPGVIRKVK
jgi:hypothetical protein